MNFGGNMSTVNMAQALSSPSYAKSLWIDYYKNGNTKGITAEEIGQIEAQWKSKLASWKASVATDDNKYIIVDSSWDADIEAGKQEGRDLTGYEGSKGQKGWQITRSAGDGVVSLGGAACRVFCKDAMQEAGAWAAQRAIEKVGEKAAETAIKEASDQLLIKTGEEVLLNNATTIGVNKYFEAPLTNNLNDCINNELTSASAATNDCKIKEGKKKIGNDAKNKAKENAEKDAGILIACTFDAVTAGLYRIQRPNKTQHEAIMKVNEDLPNQQEKTMETSAYIDTMDDEVMTLDDDANGHVDDANETMAENKTEYDFYRQYIDNLEHRKTSGEAISQEEADMYKEAILYMTESSENVLMTEAEGTEAVNEIYDTMGEYQQGYDESAENIANVEGITTYAENMDKSTRTMCYVEAGAQSLNGLLAGKDAFKAGQLAIETGWCGLGIAYGGAAILAGGAAVSDGFAAKEQFTWAGEIGGEIENRKATQEMNDATMQNYNEKVDNYAANMEDVEGLEMEVPDDIEVPTETEIPATTPGNETDDEENKKKNKK